MDIRGSVVLLTGASRGLGADTSLVLAGEGARLALLARSADELEAVAERVRAIGAEAVAVRADVADAASTADALRRVRSALGPIDVLVNNAGIELVRNFEDTPMEDVERMVGVNLTGAIRLTRLVVAEMVQRRRGQVVNIASVAGLAPVPHNAVYAATKHGLVGFSRSLRLELAEHGVGVSVVCPGFVDAGMFAAWGRQAPRLSRAVRAEAVARAVVSAVRRNRAEIVVAAGSNRLADVVVALSPTLYGLGMRWTRVEGFLREQARINAERAGTAG